jgi:hypothetical protein
VLAGIKATLAQEDQNDCLTQAEFNLIHFKCGMPALVGDLVWYLTGKTINQEDDEIAPPKTSKAQPPVSMADKEVCAGPFFDPEVEGFRSGMKPEDYAVYLSLFQRFLNYYPDEKKLASGLQPKFNEDKCYLTEEDIVGNMKNIFGYHSPYFGKLLYLMLSGGLDKAKISMSTFIKELLVFKKEDVHYVYNTFAFRLYDLDHDGVLNVMNLLHLQINIPYSSLVGQEIFK